MKDLFQNKREKPRRKSQTKSVEKTCALDHRGAPSPEEKGRSSQFLGSNAPAVTAAPSVTAGLRVALRCIPSPI